VTTFELEQARRLPLTYSQSMSENPAFTLDETVIKRRQRTLDKARKQLKNDFVGIDGIIDQLCNYVRIWYLMPEILTRPVIVNLWGMTGVGKTDLVRKLVSYLDFQDRFCEVELGGDSYNSTVAGFLTAGGIDDGKPAIVLFDEIQRFATRNGDGSDKDNGGKFADFWELLSDGRLAKRDRSSIKWMLKDRLKQMEYDRDFRKRNPNPEDQSDPDSAEIGMWDANNLIQMSGIDLDPTEVAAWSVARLTKELEKIKTTKKVYEPVDHSRTLCIISGNLDEAFNMAAQASEADIDADIFSAYTAKITVVDVKDALLRRFRPEQVARFGNIHLIYRSLRKSNFEELIARQITKVTTRVHNLFGVTVVVDPTINSLIYRNGVFPVQGVRPVFSSVTDILETNLTGFLFEAMLAKETTIAMSFDEQTNQLVAKFAGSERRIPFVGRIDDIRQGNKPDVVANVATHEAGHAVVYSALFGVAPLQLTAKVASSYAAGFTFPHQIHETRDSLISKVKVLLAGGLAEELVFGEGSASIGRSHDREQATITLVDVIRRYGFDPEFQASYMLADPYAMDRSVTDPDVEKMMARLAADTRQLLRDHQAALIDLAISVQAKGAMVGVEIAKVVSKYGIVTTSRPEGFLLVDNYDERLHA
jgi:Peptidase family M41